LQTLRSLFETVLNFEAVEKHGFSTRILNHMDAYDMVVAGGGMAGLSAALYGGWLGHTVFLAERQVFGGQIVNADQIENYPGFPDGVLGADLVSQVRMQALKLGAKMQYLETTAIKIDGSGFRLTTTEEPIQAKTVIVATGGNHRVLGIKGEAEFEGRGVSRCATCDGAFFQNQPVAVVGGGDTALDEALYLSKIASRVTIIHQGPTPIASETLLRRAREIPKMEFVANAKVEEILGTDSIEALRLSNGTQVTVSAVFTAIGFEPDANLLKDLVQLDPIGHAPVDIHMQTTVPGLFAAGSARQGNAGQLASAAGDGVTAAVAAHRYLANI
jgi:thioredoxin reductase (NADPH)